MKIARKNNDVLNMKIEINEAVASLKKLKNRHSIDKILYLNKVRKNPLLALDIEYQKKFKGYYKLRQRNAKFYESFFELFYKAAIKPKKISIESLLEQLYQKTHERHLSFCSKLLATLRDDAVIFDKNVAVNLGVSNGVLPKYGWLDEAQKRYNLIREGINQVLKQPNWPILENEFDRAFPEAKDFSKLRKADLILWMLSGKKKCLCKEPTCSKCLLSNCEDKSCAIHTRELKIKRRRRWEYDFKKPFPFLENY